MSQVYRSVLTPAECHDILEFYRDKPDAGTQSTVINKNLEYHIPGDFIHQLLSPKLHELFGEHEFDNGAYKECLQPYPLHVDTHYAHSQVTTMQTFQTATRHNCAVLIPLVHGPYFRTVTFDVRTQHNDWHTELAQHRGPRNQLCRHHYAGSSDSTFDLLAHLPVDTDYEWQLGDILTWSRDQLHVSADFASQGLTKKFLVLFLA